MRACARRSSQRRANRHTQGFDCHLDGRDHDFCAGGTGAEFVVLVRQLSIGIHRDDDLEAVVVSVVTLASCGLLMEGLRFLARCVLRIRQKKLLLSSNG